MNTPDGVTVFPATIWGLNVTRARDTYAAGKLTAEAYEQILREAVERSHDAEDVSLAMANLGQLVESRGDFEQAEGLFRRVVADADPDGPIHAASTLALANLLWQRGDGAEAGVWWRRAMFSGDSEAAPKAAFNLGAALTMQGRLDEAVGALRLAIDSGHPDEVRVPPSGSASCVRCRATWVQPVPRMNSPRRLDIPSSLLKLSRCWQNCTGNIHRRHPPGCHPLPNRPERPRQLASSVGAGHRRGGRRALMGDRSGAGAVLRHPDDNQVPLQPPTVVSAGWRSSPTCQTGNGCHHSSSTSWAGHPTATICSGSSAPSR